MKSILIFFTLFFNSPHELHQLRELFPLIGANKQSNIQMINIARKTSQIATPVKKAYLASAYMASAEFKFFPLSKLQAFNEGKKLLEECVRADKNNIEIRFIRYVIQSNVPGFLFYNSNLKEDKIFLESTLSTLKFSDPDLYQRIVNYFNWNHDNT